MARRPGPRTGSIFPLHYDPSLRETGYFDAARQDWTTVSLGRSSTTGLTSPVGVADGGTGLTALGTALQVLRTNGTATGMEWATISSGTTDHAALSSNLAWTTSGHTGTASTLGGWDGSNVAVVYTVGNGVEISGTGIRRSALTGDVTAAAGSNATTVVAITETGGPTQLTISSIADQETLYRNGSTVDGTGIAPPKETLFSFTSAGAWQHYTIPLGHTQLEIDLVGGGGGGGGGQTGADGTNRRGGGGGGSGNHSVWVGRVPLGVTQLSIQVAQGGTAGAAGTGGTAGGTSYVSVSDATTTDQRIALSGFVAANAGSAGSAGGAGGAGEQNTSANNRFGAEWGQVNSGGSQNGATGGLGAAGVTITPGTIGRTSGASGGGRSSGNVSFGGGSISASGDMALVSGGTIEGGAGGNGVAGTNPHTWTGGAGGAGGSGTGGKGGDAAPGCGGGGGGAGVTGGAGGTGGDGWVRIRTW